MKLPRHRLFVLGAGFSAPAGLPLAKGLLDAVRDHVRSSYRSRAGWDGPLEDEIEEWGALYPGESVDLERVLAYSHRKHFLRLLGSKEYFAHGSRSIAASRRAIQEVLLRKTPIETPSLYQAFARQLTPSDVVLTFNYDTLLEQALEDVERPYSLTPEWWLDDCPDGGRCVDVLKLHGSIDWYDRHYHDDANAWFEEEGHEVPDRDPLFGPNASVMIESLARGPVEAYGASLLPRVFRVPRLRDHFPLRGRHAFDLVPFILPLAYDKLLGHDPILDLWENLHRTLDAYSAIIMIGYSLPMYDSYAYEALGHLMTGYQCGGERTYWGQRRVPIQLVTLAAPGTNGLEGIPFLDPRQVRVWSGGFSADALEWVDWGEDNLAE